jgi:hypothetical protein
MLLGVGRGLGGSVGAMVRYGGGNASGWRRDEEISFCSGCWEPGKRFGNGCSGKEFEDLGVSGSGIVEANAAVDVDWILEQ